MGFQIHLKGRSKAAFVKFRGRERSSIFIKSGRNMEYIRRGMAFRRVKADKSVETARILSVVLDGLQIPHVRYEVALQRPSRAAVSREGPRTLSWTTFAHTYRERVNH